jgi:hypothetical protein
MAYSVEKIENVANDSHVPLVTAHIRLRRKFFSDTEESVQTLQLAFVRCQPLEQ